MNVRSDTPAKHRWLLCTKCHTPIAEITSTSTPAVSTTVTCFDCADRQAGASFGTHQADALADSGVTTAVGRGVWRALAHDTSTVRVALDGRTVQVGDTLRCEVRGNSPYLWWTGDYKVSRVDQAAMTAFAKSTTHSDTTRYPQGDPLQPSEFLYFDTSNLRMDWSPMPSEESFASWQLDWLLDDDPEYQAIQSASDSGDAWEWLEPERPEFTAFFNKYLGTEILTEAIEALAGDGLFNYGQDYWSFLDDLESHLQGHPNIDTKRFVSERVRLHVLGAFANPSLRQRLWVDILQPWMLSDGYRQMVDNLIQAAEQEQAARQDPEEMARRAAKSFASTEKWLSEGSFNTDCPPYTAHADTAESSNWTCGHLHDTLVDAFRCVHRNGHGEGSFHITDGDGHSAFTRA